LLYIITALYAEAKPLIHAYELKKQAQLNRFQIFQGEHVKLIVTGTGKMEAAIATTYLLSQQNVTPTDVLLNVGLCGAVNKQLAKGTAILAHQLLDYETKRAYYPDILLSHRFEEGSIETFSVPVTQALAHKVTGSYVDMEATGIYQAASLLLAPHQMLFVKIISDYLGDSVFAAEQVSQWITAQLAALMSYLEALQAVLEPPVDPVSEEDKQMIEEVSKHLKLSTTMYHEWTRLYRQAKLNNRLHASVLTDILHMEVPSKQEGKRIFEQLKKRLQTP
jgi:nucleoside phosphorylase